MSEEQTKNFTNGPTLRQIFTKLDVMDTRLQSVETKVSERGYDTKPIWERALSEILQVKNDVAVLKHDLGDVKNDVSVLKNDMTVMKHELGHVKHELALMNRKIQVFSNDMLKLRAEQVSVEDRLRALEA